MLIMAQGIKKKFLIRWKNEFHHLIVLQELSLCRDNNYFICPHINCFVSCVFTDHGKTENIYLKRNKQR